MHGVGVAPTFILHDRITPNCANNQEVTFTFISLFVTAEFDNWYADSFLTADDPVQTAQQAGFGQRQGTSYNPNVAVRMSACTLIASIGNSTIEHQTNQSALVPFYSFCVHVFRVFNFTYHT